jgi:hypothetical protein
MDETIDLIIRFTERLPTIALETTFGGCFKSRTRSDRPPRRKLIRSRRVILLLVSYDDGKLN